MEPQYRWVVRSHPSMSRHDPMGRGHDNHRYGGKPQMASHEGHSGHPIHHKRARGGGVANERGDEDAEELGEGHEDARKGTMKAEVYAGKGSNTEKEAERRKNGGKRAAGGKVATKPKLPALAVGGAPSRHIRMDRRGRKRGGSVGADSHPLTEASRMKE